jgi:hypothetical protein
MRPVYDDDGRFFGRVVIVRLPFSGRGPMRVAGAIAAMFVASIAALAMAYGAFAYVKSRYYEARTQAVRSEARKDGPRPVVLEPRRTRMNDERRYQDRTFERIPGGVIID